MPDPVGNAGRTVANLSRRVGRKIEHNQFRPFFDRLFDPQPPDWFLFMQICGHDQDRIAGTETSRWVDIFAARDADLGNNFSASQTAVRQVNMIAL